MTCSNQIEATAHLSIHSNSSLGCAPQDRNFRNLWQEGIQFRASEKLPFANGKLEPRFYLSVRHRSITPFDISFKANDGYNRGATVLLHALHFI